MWYSVRAKVGIALKLAGCALIHGRGNHLWGDPVDVYGVSVAACRSCGKYRHL